MPSIGHVLEAVRRAWELGRPIVPVIGAGFSADSGYPILNSICRYLSRFKFALDERLLLPRWQVDDEEGRFVAERVESEMAGICESAVKKPIEYIRRFGWPDRFELTQLVAREVGRGDSKNAHQRIEEVITKGFDWLAEKSTSARAANRWGSTWHNGPGDKSQPLTAWNRWSVQGDWRRLIQFFTGYQGDYGDDLFARFGLRRTPGPAHRYMTLLVKLLSVEVVFTFNFDDLIERALTLDAVPYRVFGMEHGRSLPSPRTTGHGVSVVKMHGSHHSVLIDESLDRPLTPEYIGRFYDLAGRNALLLVLGCSGDDRRLEDLVVGHPRRGLDPRDPGVCWVHFEAETEVAQWISKQQQSAHLTGCPTNNPGKFVRHLLFDISGRYPESAHPYLSHPLTPVPQGKPPEDVLTVNKVLVDPGGNNFTSRLDIKSSEELLKIGSACLNCGFVVIWVDLESVYTLAGLVGAIIDGCRRVDAELPPAVMPLETLGGVSNKPALGRLEHALQRQRYAVLVDGIRTYGSSPLMHHSPKCRPDSATTDGVNTLKSFLDQLANTKNLGQSIIIASVDGAEPRRVENLVGTFIPPWEQFTPDTQLFWSCLATIRRTRGLPALRVLLAPLIDCRGDERKVDRVLVEAATENSPIRQLEGGDVWYERQSRDKLYTFITQFTSGEHVQRIAAGAEKPWDAARQSLQMALMHKKIASTYFSVEFMQSGDAAAFLEYTYHRISSIRYFSRAIYLWVNYGKDLSQALNGKRWGVRFVDEVAPGWDSERFTEYFGAGWKELDSLGEPADVVTRLLARRVCELQALVASWEEFEHRVRSQVPAEQLIHWGTEICDQEFKDRLSTGYLGESLRPPAPAHGPTDDAIRQLEAYFNRLRARVHLERGDPAAARKLLAPGADTSPNSERLDTWECALRGEDSTAPEKRPGLSETELSGEDLHRWRHLNALHHLGGISWLEFDIVNGQLQATGLDVAKAESCAREGIEGIRGPGASLAPPLKGMIVSAGSPGGAYLPYRSVFRTLLGRATALKLLTSPLRDRAESDLPLFREAMREFDQAKSGLDGRQSLLRGWADLHAAEATLLLVRRTFDRDEVPLGLIKTKLHGSRAHIRSAISSLLVGRRNSLWWRRCCQLIAQYHTERLFVDLCCLLAPAGASEGGADPRSGPWDGLRRRSRLALEMVAAFADYTRVRSDALNTDWARRSLLEVHLATAVGVSLYDQQWPSTPNSVIQSAPDPAPEATPLAAVATALWESSRRECPRAFADDTSKLTGQLAQAVREYEALHKPPLPAAPSWADANRCRGAIIRAVRKALGRDVTGPTPSAAGDRAGSPACGSGGGVP